MSFRRTALLFYLINAQILEAQNLIGLGAALHRYDQVISVKGVKVFPNGTLGLEIGCGVERSLQGALAPQLALIWQAPLQSKNKCLPIQGPFYMLRYQFDFQKAGVIDTYHGFYVGIGHTFGSEARFSLQLALGVVAEKIYTPIAVPNNFHFLLNQQVQINYYFRNKSK